MSDATRSRSVLEEQDMVYQRREWQVERLGWILAGILLALALMGYFGRGPVSNRTAVAGSGAFQTRYERFLRRHSPSRLIVAIPAGRPLGDIRLWINHSYLDAVDVESITPRLTREELDDEGVAFIFAQDAQDGPAEIALQLRPTAWGTVQATLRLNGGESATIDQFVYP